MENLSAEQTIAILNNPMEYLSEKKTRIVGIVPDTKAMRIYYKCRYNERQAVL